MNTLEGNAWRTLAGFEGIGSSALWMIADYLTQQRKTASWLFENPEKFKEIFHAGPFSLAASHGNKLKNLAAGPTGKQPITVLHPFHPDFPERIRGLKNKMSVPALLYVRGNMEILKKPAIAVVGKRNTGAMALAVTNTLAAELAAKEINLTSGYASGIDTAAHLAALRAGGTTSIILAEGIRHFKVKPSLSEFLTKKNTLVISQFEPDAKWAPYMAMTRNRLVGALSQALMVIISGPEHNDSGRHSGTFNAAISAQKMGIPVFVAAPSFFNDPPAGNEALIARGCRAWDPASGIESILAAIDRNIKKNYPKQLTLFKQNGD
ncbi:MAG: DNA-processing protein DprA [Candidatus Aminicenantes bacterium]|nr:DNA-processing protein DprA [Candidatus Aminicenantes bacterium]